jgi:hypothetical protein
LQAVGQRGNSFSVNTYEHVFFTCRQFRESGVRGNMSAYNLGDSEELIVHNFVRHLANVMEFGYRVVDSHRRGFLEQFRFNPRTSLEEIYVEYLDSLVRLFDSFRSGGINGAFSRIAYLILRGENGRYILNFIRGELIRLKDWVEEFQRRDVEVIVDGRNFENVQDLRDRIWPIQMQVLYVSTLFHPYY